MTEKKKELTPKQKKPTVKQQRFIDYYDGNGVETARKAGYKGNDRTLNAVAVENLSKPFIKDAIEKREVKGKKKGIKTREERQQFWSDLMDSATQDKDKLKASELLGKSNADFTANIKHSGEIGVKPFNEIIKEANKKQ